MSRVLVLVEGQTEENFIKGIFAPYFEPKNIYTIPIILKTKRIVTGPDFKGGVTSYGKFCNDLSKLFFDGDASVITTMIDYYALPDDFPGCQEALIGTAWERVEFIETKLKEQFPDIRFLPYIQLHEFEALVFACEKGLAELFENRLTELQEVGKIIEKFGSPELINDGRETAPSKRLKRIFPEYQKENFGSLILGSSDVDDLRVKCPHFDNWISEIERRCHS